MVAWQESLDYLYWLYWRGKTRRGRKHRES